MLLILFEPGMSELAATIEQQMLQTKLLLFQFRCPCTCLHTPIAFMSDKMLIASKSRPYFANVMLAASFHYIWFFEA